MGTANRSLRLVGRQVPQIMSRAHLTTDVASELCTKGAEELAALNRAREVTSREVVDPYLARIEKINPSVRTMRSVTRRATTSACAPMLPIARGDRPPAGGDCQTGPFAHVTRFAHLPGAHVWPQRAEAAL